MREEGCGLPRVEKERIVGKDVCRKRQRSGACMPFGGCRLGSRSAAAVPCRPCAMPCNASRWCQHTQSFASSVQCELLP